MNRNCILCTVLCVCMAIPGGKTERPKDSNLPLSGEEKKIMSEINEKELYEETPLEIFIYEVKDGELYIYGLYDNGLEVLIVPNEIEGCPVTEFDANYVADNGTIHTIVIPRNVKRLPCSFQNMDALETLLVEEGSEYFTSRDSAGRECNAILEIGTGVLVYGCRTTEIPEEITTIGEYAFHGCAGLVKTEIPGNITIIEGDAFNGTPLRQIEIPNSVTFLGGGAFCDCYDLEKVKLSEKISEIQEFTFAACESLKEIEIPEGVVRIAECAFKDSALKKITMPKSLEVIEEEAFSGCDDLRIIAPKGSYAETWARENGYSVSVK